MKKRKFDKITVIYDLDSNRPTALYVHRDSYASLEEWETAAKEYLKKEDDCSELTNFEANVSRVMVMSPEPDGFCTYGIEDLGVDAKRKQGRFPVWRADIKEVK